MKLLFLLFLSVQATNLRQQTEHSECEICLNLFHKMQNASFTSVEVLRTRAREVCHAQYSGPSEKSCLSITDDAMLMAEHLFDPNGCESTGYCTDCKPCGEDCYSCKDNCYIARLFQKLWNM